MKSVVRFLVALAVLSFGVFVLPYVIKPSSTILSASFLVGFNNSLAYAWYGVSLVLGGRVVSMRGAGRHVLASFESDQPLFVRPTMPVVAIMLGHALLFGALYVKAHGFTFGEPLYFEDAAYRAQSGAVPFIDFYFFYGPLMISPVAFLARFVGVFPAYGLYYVATYLVGLYLLFVVIATMARGRDVTLWFVVFAIGFFNPITGLNYTFVRFMLPMVTLFAAWKCYRAPSLAAWSGGVVLFTLAVLCSPDVAIVTVGSVGVMGAVLLWVETRRMVSAPGIALVAIPVCGLLLSFAAMLLIDGTFRPVAAYLMPVVTFSAGGWSTPIDPSVPMMSLVIASLVAAMLVWSAWRDGVGTPATAVIAAFGVLLVLMQRASFGKSDIQHIAFSGLPAYLAAATWAPSDAPRGRTRQWATALLLVGVVGSLQFYHAMLFVPSLLQKRSRTTTSLAEATPSAPVATKEEMQQSIQRAVTRFGTDRLYYMHRLEYFRLPVYVQHRLRPFMYFPTLASAFTAADIDRVVTSLRANPDAVVLARRADLVVTTPVTKIPTRWWFYATSSPIPGSDVFNLTLEFQARLEAPLVSVLNTEYDVAFEDGEVVGLIRRVPVPPAASGH